MEEKMIHLTIMGRTAAVLNDSTVNEAATVVFGLGRPTSLFDLPSGRQVDPTRPFIDQGLTGSIELVTRYVLRNVFCPNPSLAFSGTHIYL